MSELKEILEKNITFNVNFYRADDPTGDIVHDKEKLISELQTYISNLLDSTALEEKEIYTFDFDYTKVEHEWILDYTRNDTGQTKVYRCKHCSSVRKENEVIYYENCSGDDWGDKPCICTRASIKRGHYPEETKKEETQESKRDKTVWNEAVAEQHKRIKLVKEGL